MLCFVLSVIAMDKVGSYAAQFNSCCYTRCVPLLDRSGFVGTEVVKQLLEKGYTVRATVRSTSNKQKVAHLLALGDALPGAAAASSCFCVCTVQFAGLIWRHVASLC